MKPMACEAKKYFLCSMEGEKMVFISRIITRGRGTGEAGEAAASQEI